MSMTQEQYIINEKGKKTAIILPIKQYEQLLEDLHDLAIVAERREESVISLDEMKKRLELDEPI
ncbi:TPA: type II toxin-antitoxin system Phd/YefM family antitoxin [bacterium]|nr:type II toxin-antitoxin system Phd/YefM family antitoxin [bacterium]